MEKRTKDGSVKTKAVNNISTPNQWPQPRWVRVNTIKTSIDEQLRTTFAGYTTVDLLEALSSSNIEKLVHIDKHVPNLLALPPFTDLTKTSAYINGQIILQDKASCFPAFLLDPKAEDGDCLDACAAPGNKTTHLASIIHNQGPSNPNPTIFACERDNYRAQTLLEMIQKSGATSYVTVKPGHDFLRIDPTKSPWDSIGTLLVDPSCSGSGIVDRDKVLKVVLPSKEPVNLCQAKSKKRKRNPAVRPDQTSLEVPVEILTNENMLSDQLSNRLTALSTFQLKLLLHAFQFPKALKITYSTCSIYAQENEHVVMKALSSAVAKQRGWQILNRQDQVPGMRSWIIRGNAEWCREVGSAEDRGYADIAEACIRCEKGTRVGTQGFFVAAFVRDPKKPGIDVSMDLEWEGFSEGSVA